MNNYLDEAVIVKSRQTNKIDFVLGAGDYIVSDNGNICYLYRDLQKAKEMFASLMIDNSPCDIIRIDAVFEGGLKDGAWSDELMYLYTELADFSPDDKGEYCDTLDYFVDGDVVVDERVHHE